MDSTSENDNLRPSVLNEAAPGGSVPTAPVAEALIPPPARSKRGFAVLSPEKKREIASMGGKAAHEHGRAHRFTSEEARAAGKKRHQLRMAAAAAAATKGNPTGGSGNV